MATIAYIRVSKDTQDVDNQRFEIQNYAAKEGLTIDTWVEAEISSRKSTKARKIDSTLDTLRRGDILIISEISRIGRSILENLNTINELKKKKVTTHIIKQTLKVNGDNDLMTTMFITNLSFAAELERALISQRTKAALARKKAEGITLGNPHLADEHARQKQERMAHLESVRERIQELVDRGYTQRQICDTLNMEHIPTLRGGKWYIMTLQRTLKQIQDS
jgi:DNA invertase Pin-like site-specific DNA recombinase